MAVEVKLPQFGMGMASATIARWLKQEGEAVALDEPLVEIEAEKSVNEVTAPGAGRLLAIMAPEGATVPVYDVIALIGQPGETAAAAPSPAPPPEVAPAPAAGAPAAAAQASVQAAPLARRLAREAGLDLETLTGSGPGGRLTDADVRAAIAARADAGLNSGPGSGSGR